MSSALTSSRWRRSRYKLRLKSAMIEMISAMTEMQLDIAGAADRVRLVISKSITRLVTGSMCPPGGPAKSSGVGIFLAISGVLGR